jgi:hypothetical protein
LLLRWVCAMWRPSSPRRDGIHSIELGSSRIKVGNLV